MFDPAQRELPDVALEAINRAGPAKEARSDRAAEGMIDRRVSVTGDTMKVESTEFGSITIDGETYHHDVLIRLSGKIEKRKKKLSKKLFGTSHIMSLEEAKFVHEKDSELLVLGTGQNDNVRLSPEAAAFFARKGCKVLAEATPHAVATFNREKGRRIGLFHVTC